MFNPAEVGSLLMSAAGAGSCNACCRYIFKQGHADAWLHLYTNGKSAVRPDAPGVTQGGPHVFLGPADKRYGLELESMAWLTFAATAAYSI